MFFLSVSSFQMYTVKKVSDLPIPSRDVINQAIPGREQ